MSSELWPDLSGHPGVHVTPATFSPPNEYRLTGYCADGMPCGAPENVGDDAYCMGCPNRTDKESLPVADDPHEAPCGSDASACLMNPCGRCDSVVKDFFAAEGIKQARYQDAKGEDWIDEFARTATPEEFRGAMRFTIGKYNRRAGKKDELVSEIRKMRDYCGRWLAYEEGG